jgi:hypothetical protein
MEREEGESSGESGASARAASRCRKVDDAPENPPRASWSPSANKEREADDSQQGNAAAIDQLEQQIRRHLSGQVQQPQQQPQQHPKGELQEVSQPQHENDSRGSVMPYPYRRGGAWDGAGVGTDSVQEGDAPTADMRGEASTAPSNPIFHQVPAAVMPPLAKSYLFPSSLIAQPAPSSTNPPNLAELSQRMEPAPIFYQETVGGHSNVDDGIGGFLRDAPDRSPSGVTPQPLPPYTNLSRPSIRSFANAERGPFAHPGRNYGSNAGSTASLPFPIITIPFRSTTARPPVAAAAGAAQGLSTATAGIGAPSGLHGPAAAFSTSNLQSLAAGLAWDGPFPTSGKEPTFPMKLYVQEIQAISMNLEPRGTLTHEFLIGIL